MLRVLDYPARLLTYVVVGAILALLYAFNVLGVGWVYGSGDERIGVGAYLTVVTSVLPFVERDLSVTIDLRWMDWTVERSNASLADGDVKGFQFGPVGVALIWAVPVEVSV